MKLEWRKHEKDAYWTKGKPRYTVMKPQQYIALEGSGNPNNPEFSLQVSALYPIAYGIKMAYKKSPELHGLYNDFTVFPLEGIWDLIDTTVTEFSKDNLKFTLMIRQPDFIDEALFNQVKAATLVKNDNPYINDVHFITLNEGPVIEMMHLGPFDTEPETFALMERYAQEINHPRKDLTHREIYLSDFRRVDASRLKTILRFKCE